MSNPEKFDMNTLQICPPHLLDVAALPWEIQKSHILSNFLSGFNMPKITKVS